MHLADYKDSGVDAGRDDEYAYCVVAPVINATLRRASADQAGR